MHIGNAAILLHLLVETPGTNTKRSIHHYFLLTQHISACISFLFQPNAQLRDLNPQPDAVLICQSYAGLLLATNMFCLLFLKSRGIDHFDDTGTILAGSLAIYHAFPIRRAWVRIQQRKLPSTGRGHHSHNEEAVALGGPVLHFVIHLLLLFLLAGAALNGSSS